MHNRCHQDVGIGLCEVADVGMRLHDIAVRSHSVTVRLHSVTDMLGALRKVGKCLDTSPEP